MQIHVNGNRIFIMGIPGEYIQYMDFSGQPSQNNRNGARQFDIKLDSNLPDEANVISTLQSIGIFLSPKNDGKYHLKCKLTKFSPQVTQITSNGCEERWEEQDLAKLNGVDFGMLNVEISFNNETWSNTSGTGRYMWLQAMQFTIRPNPMQEYLASLQR